MRVVPILLLLLCGCGYYEAREEERLLHQQAAAEQAMVKARQDQPEELSREQQAWQQIADGALLVDVRTAEEYALGKLEGSVLIPHDEVERRVAEFGEDKDRPIVVYCRSGGRAGKARDTLTKLGYTQVLNAGGYHALLTAKP